MNLPLILSFGLLLGISSLKAQTEPVGPLLPPEGRTFRNFSGVCQARGKVDSFNNFVGWTRDDLSWEDMEPQRGQWDQAKLKKWGDRVLELRAAGVEFLPILCYGARWSIDMKPRTLQYGDGRRVEVKPAPSGDALLVITSHKNEQGEWIAEPEKSVKNHPLSQIGEEFVPDWEAYVRRVVAFLSAPPYNLKYFQVWNEAHAESGFWRFGDSLDPYMKRVHLPAARIIKQLGGKVVYGGWPCCGSVKEYVDLLDRHDAWKSIDVHDLHYFPVSSFEYIYRAAKKRGVATVSIWQTEIGFTANPSAIGNDYPRFLDWSLRHDWDQEDQYKLFWFAAGSPDSPKAYGYKCSLLLGDKLSPHGLTLQTLGRLLVPGKLALYKQKIETVPVLRSEIDEHKSSIEAFTVDDKKIVLAIHLVSSNDAKILTDWNGDLVSLHIDHGNPSVQIRLTELNSDRVASVRRMDSAGTISKPRVIQDKTLSLEVPIRDEKASPSAKWVQESAMQTFFVEILLK